MTPIRLKAALGAATFCLLASCAAAPAGEQAQSGQAAARYLPQYTEAGELVLPEGFERWIYLGSPLTPNALNNGAAPFPEFHNVYMEPAAYDEYKRTGVFPEGTIMFKELQLTTEAQLPDGSRSEPSGRGYFPGKLNGADVTVKDSKRFADTGGWGYFNFNHSEPKARTAAPKPREECAFCHIENAKKDSVWTQFYPRLGR